MTDPVTETRGLLDTEVDEVRRLLLVGLCDRVDELTSAIRAHRDGVGSTDTSIDEDLWAHLPDHPTALVDRDDTTGGTP